MLTVGKFHVGRYCGAKIFRRSDWRLYGRFHKWPYGFSIGPVLFWKE